MMRRCSHPFCRTSLEDVAATCPHDMPFCEDCIWEEVCSECAR